MSFFHILNVEMIPQLQGKGKKKGQKSGRNKKANKSKNSNRKNSKKSNVPQGSSDLLAKLYATMEKHKEVRIIDSLSYATPNKGAYKNVKRTDYFEFSAKN